MDAFNRISSQTYNEAFKFFNMTYQFEMILSGVKSMYIGISTLEIIIFCLAMLFTLGASKTGVLLWFMIFNLIHLGRSVVGLYVSKLVPNTHDVTRKLLKFKEERKQLVFAQIKPSITQ